MSFIINSLSTIGAVESLFRLMRAFKQYAKGKKILKLWWNENKEEFIALRLSA
jgi:hypothetical protein